MGVKGLQGFVENAGSEVCVQVDLREMAEQHLRSHPGSQPTLVVDGTACLRLWYHCQAWVHGGQWREYLQSLREFVGAFSCAGIRLVFFFDGVVEEVKRPEWVRRRLRVNAEVAELFRHLRECRQQPGRRMLCLPSGLATFSRFALKSLGQETWSSVREADYEIAAYAQRHGCMGILGQDTDFLIFDSAPYLSVSKLRLDKMSTVMFSREMLCSVLQLDICDLPLLACVLGNDVVPEQRLQQLRRDCMAACQRKVPGLYHQGNKVFSMADFVRRHRPPRQGSQGMALLPLTDGDRVLLEKGVKAYLLPGQQSPWVTFDPLLPPTTFAMEKYSYADVLEAAKERHIRAESFMVYNVLHDGIVECSNTLEDQDSTRLPPHAAVYRPARERIYGLLLLHTEPGHDVPAPTVKEWFVSPGSLLREADIVSPSPLNQPGRAPDLRDLWFGTAPGVDAVRVNSFLAIFDLQEMANATVGLDTPLIAVVCLVTYLALQDSCLCLEDIDAYLSQAVCVKFKSDAELAGAKVSRVEPRAVQLGSLFVRGLTVLLAANSACGCPFPTDGLMPWATFDGLLFHLKYLLAHSGGSIEELLEGDEAWMSLFVHVRGLVLGVCERRGIILVRGTKRAESGKPAGGREGRPRHFKETVRLSTLPQNNGGPRRGPGAHAQGHDVRSRRPNRQQCRLAPRWLQHQTPRPDCP